MRTYLSAILSILMIAISLTSCKKNDAKTEPYKCTTCNATPEALAANDGSSKGIYKGLVIGSTGTIKFDIQNGGSTIKAYLTIDGTPVELTSSVSWVGGESYIAAFTGTMNGQPVSIGFSVSSSGGSPSVTASNIPGHPNAQFVIEKEISSALIECFEGTYTTDGEKGTFNILLSRTLGIWEGIARANGSIDVDEIEGSLGNGKLFNDDGDQIGTLSNDEMSGKFHDDDGTTEFKGKRTL